MPAGGSAERGCSSRPPGKQGHPALCPTDTGRGSWGRLRPCCRVRAVWGEGVRNIPLPTSRSWQSGELPTGLPAPTQPSLGWPCPWGPQGLLVSFASSSLLQPRWEAPAGGSWRVSPDGAPLTPAVPRLWLFLRKTQCRPAHRLIVSSCSPRTAAVGSCLPVPGLEGGSPFLGFASWGICTELHPRKDGLDGQISEQMHEWHGD